MQRGLLGLCSIPTINVQWSPIHKMLIKIFCSPHKARCVILEFIEYLLNIHIGLFEWFAVHARPLECFFNSYKPTQMMFKSYKTTKCSSI